MTVEREKTEYATCAWHILSVLGTQIPMVEEATFGLLTNNARNGTVRDHRSFLVFRESSSRSRCRQSAIFKPVIGVDWYRNSYETSHLFKFYLFSPLKKDEGNLTLCEGERNAFVYQGVLCRSSTTLQYNGHTRGF